MDLIQYKGKQVRVYLSASYFHNRDGERRTLKGELVEIDKKFIQIDKNIIGWYNVLFIDTDIDDK